MKVFSYSQKRKPRLINIIIFESNLNNTKITLIGAEMLFDSLKHNSHLCELDLSDNNLSGHNINKIQILLWTNRELRKLNLANCMLGKEAA